jgi:hypothetical protein
VPEGEPHPVDEFIDPQLSRHRLTWDDVPVLPELAAVADQVWAACERLADAGGSDAEAEAAMDAAGERYAAMYRAAVQLAQDATTAAANDARREGRREGRKRAKADPEVDVSAAQERAQRASRNPDPDKPGLVARITRRARG